MTVEDISRRIEALANERGISKYALADKCPQVVQSTVYNALSGKMCVYSLVCGRWSDLFIFAVLGIAALVILLFGVVIEDKLANVVVKMRGIYAKTDTRTFIKNFRYDRML